MNLLFSPSKQTKGQGLVEYAIIIALVAIVVIAVVRVIGPSIGNTFSTINNSLPGESNEVGNPSSPACVAASAAHGNWHANWDGNPSANMAEHDALQAAMVSACGGSSIEP